MNIYIELSWIFQGEYMTFDYKLLPLCIIAISKEKILKTCEKNVIAR